jgi:hypothetical protein
MATNVTRSGGSLLIGARGHSGVPDLSFHLNLARKSLAVRARADKSGCGKIDRVEETELKRQS